MKSCKISIYALILSMMATSLSAMQPGNNGHNNAPQTAPVLANGLRIASIRNSNPQMPIYYKAIVDFQKQPEWCAISADNNAPTIIPFNNDLRLIIATQPDDNLTYADNQVVKVLHFKSDDSQDFRQKTILLNVHAVPCGPHRFAVSIQPEALERGPMLDTYHAMGIPAADATNSTEIEIATHIETVPPSLPDIDVFSGMNPADIEAIIDAVENDTAPRRHAPSAQPSTSAEQISTQPLTNSQSIWQSISQVAQAASAWVRPPQMITAPFSTAAAVVTQGVRAIAAALQGGATVAIVPSNNQNAINTEIQNMLANTAPKTQPKPSGKGITDGELRDGIIQDKGPAIPLTDQVDMAPTARTAMPDTALQSKNANVAAPTRSRVATNKAAQTNASTQDAAREQSEKTAAVQPAFPVGNADWRANTTVEDFIFPEDRQDQAKAPGDYDNFVDRTKRAEQGVHQNPRNALANTERALAAQQAELEAAEKKQSQFVYVWQNPDSESEEQKEAQSTTVMPNGPGQEPPSSDDENNEDVAGKTGNNLQNQTKEQLLKTKRSFEKLIQEHEEKLEAYRKNPDAHDNKGLLKNAKSPAEREQIIRNRIKVLETQIESQRENLRKTMEHLSKFKD